MKKSLLLILFASLLVSNAEAAPIQWDVASGGNGHYYEFIDVGSKITWIEANTLAGRMSFQGIQGHLATITSEEENFFLSGKNLLVPSFSNYVWLGGEYKNGGWTWVTGEEWDYTYWHPDGRPLNPRWWPYLCKHFPAWTHFWLNIYDNYNRVHGYIVEYDAPPSTIPEPNTMVLFGMGCLGFAKVFRKKLS